MDDALLVEVADAGDELGEQPAGGGVPEVAVVEDVVEELAAGGVLEDDAHVALGLDELVQADDIRMIELLEDRDLAVDLGQAGGVAGEGLLADQLDRDLHAALLLPAHLDLAELALAQGLAEDVVAELDLLPMGGGLEVFLAAALAGGGTPVRVGHASLSDETQAGDGGGIGAGSGGSCLGDAGPFAGDVGLRIIDYYVIDDGTVLARQMCVDGRLSDGGL